MGSILDPCIHPQSTKNDEFYRRCIALRNPFNNAKANKSYCTVINCKSIRTDTKLKISIWYQVICRELREQPRRELNTIHTFMLNSCLHTLIVPTTKIIHSFFILDDKVSAGVIINSPITIATGKRLRPQLDINVW
jgi:hypothetical protein